MNPVLALRGSLFSNPRALSAALLLGGAQLAFLAQLYARDSEVQIAPVASDVRDRLSLADRFAAAGAWDQALDTWIALLVQDSPGGVPLADGLAISVREMCHRRLATLPPAVLAEYRRRVDEQAGRWYEQAWQQRDTRLLQRIVEQHFCSSWGDDALLALGDIALERGDYQMARDAWQRLSPALRDKNRLAATLPAGRQSATPALAGDLRTPPGGQTAGWLTFPDTSRPLADIRARLVLVSLRAGELERAKRELQSFHALHPDADGQLGGRRGRLASLLDRLAVDARGWHPTTREDQNSWPTVAGAAARHRRQTTGITIRGLAWQTTEAALAPAEGRDDAPHRDGGNAMALLHPVVRDGQLFVSDGRRVWGWLLATGESVLQVNEFDPLPADETAVARHGSPVRTGVPHSTLTIADDVLYARLGDPVTWFLRPHRRRTAARLMGFDLARQGRVCFDVAPEEPFSAFDGVPVSDGEDVFVAIRNSDTLPGVEVACFAADDGRLRWRRPIATASMTGSGNGNQITHSLLTLVEERVYLNSNMGVVAALAKSDGALRWVRTYERTSRVAGQPLARHVRRDANPCIYFEGCLLIAPADTPAVFAVDAATGGILWECRSAADSVHLLGVADRKLFLGGAKLWALNVENGRVVSRWSPYPQRDDVDHTILGRGCVAGDVVYWPTDDELHVLDAANLDPLQSSISLSATEIPSGNVIVAEGYAVIAANSKISVFAGQPVGGPAPLLSESPLPASTGAERGP